MERLQKMIASSGLCSRRKAEELILSGKVRVNGIEVKTLGTKVSYEDNITVDNKKLKREKNEYYLLNKPRGVVCTTSDEKGRENICELIDTRARIFPVGRLDYDTTGLIILTNDGKLANILMHPSYKVEKTYLAKIEGNLTMEELYKLKSGIVIDNIPCEIIKVKIKKRDLESKTELIEITVREGRNHLIKKIFAQINHSVIRLTRTKYAHLSLGNLQSGEYRHLTEPEVKELYDLKK